MTDIDRERAASAALGALTPDEAALLDEEVVKDRALADEVEGYRLAVATLESGVARERPSPELFDRVLAQIDSEDAAVARPAPRVQRVAARRPRRLFPAIAGFAAAAVAAIALVLAVFDENGLGGPTARAAIQGTPDFAGVQGEARLYSPEQDDGVLALDLRDVPSPGPDEHYEIWVLRESAGDRMEAVGVFTPATPDVQLEVRLPGSGEYKAVDISIEPNAGPAEHSGTSLAGGSFEAAA